jgi:hypothetical protein
MSRGWYQSASIEDVEGIRATVTSLDGSLITDILTQFAATKQDVLNCVNYHATYAQHRALMDPASGIQRTSRPARKPRISSKITNQHIFSILQNALFDLNDRFFTDLNVMGPEPALAIIKLLNGHVCDTGQAAVDSGSLKTASCVFTALLELGYTLLHTRKCKLYSGVQRYFGNNGKLEESMELVLSKLNWGSRVMVYDAIAQTDNIGNMLCVLEELAKKQSCFPHLGRVIEVMENGF